MRKQRRAQSNGQIVLCVGREHLPSLSVGYFLLGMILASGLWGSHVQAQKRKPIVAVFDIETRRFNFDREVLVSLSDYLAARMTATGAYQVIPRQQLKERLLAQKLESYKQCYDQSCQIEIGRELAANSVLSSHVIKVGEECELALELFDLKTAATEHAETAKGGCTEEGLFRSINRAVQLLAASRSAKKTTPYRQAVVDISSEPSWADVMIDGLDRGRTPLRIQLETGRTYHLTLNREHFEPFRSSFQPESWKEIQAVLELDQASRNALATSTEWVALELGSGYLAWGNVPVLACDVRIVTLKWKRFMWTLGELGGALSFGSGGYSAMNVGTRPGFPLYFDQRGHHQFWFTLGGFFTRLTRGGENTTGTSSGLSDESHSLFALSPAIQYLYQPRSQILGGMVLLGAGLKTYLPVAGDFGDRGYPLQILGTFSIGFTYSKIISSIYSSNPMHRLPPEPNKPTAGFGLSGQATVTGPVE
jgi:hypothetical protein